MESSRCGQIDGCMFEEDASPPSDISKSFAKAMCDEVRQLSLFVLHAVGRFESCPCAFIAVKYLNVIKLYIIYICSTAIQWFILPSKDYGGDPIWFQLLNIQPHLQILSLFLFNFFVKNQLQHIPCHPLFFNTHRWAKISPKIQIKPYLCFEYYIMTTDTSQRALSILRLSQRFPADQSLAEAHYRSQWFAPEMFYQCTSCHAQFNQNVIVCPNCGINIEKTTYHCTCCRHKVRDNQYGFCIDSTNVALSPDIVVFFSFIKLVFIYFLFRFLILDVYTIYFNWAENSCKYISDRINCPRTIFTRLATLRRIEDIHSIYTFDLINLGFVLFSIIYLLCCENYLNSTFLKVANTIQTEDDYSIYVYNIPVLLDEQQFTSHIGYAKALTSYFEEMVKDWIKTNTQKMNQGTSGHQADIFRDYVRVAQARGDNYATPSKMVTNINLCWDLEEIVNIRRQRRRIMRTFQRKARGARAGQASQFWGLDQETEAKLLALDKAEIEVSNKFAEKNYSSEFVIGRFLGKAFVSFEYQHFAHALIESIHETEKFSTFKEIEIMNAPFPQDVHWGNLNIEESERKERILTTFLLTFGCIAVGFAIVLGLRYTFKNYYKIDDYDTNAGYLILAGSAGVTILILSINYFTKWLVGLLTDYEEHETKTNEEQSLLFKLLLSSFFNLVLSTLVVWKFMGVGVWDRNGLAVQVFVIMVVALIIEMFLAIVNWPWLWRWISLKCKYRPAEPILEFQFIYNNEYELPDFKIAEKFNFYLWQSYFLSFYSYIVPASSIVGLIAIGAHYFIDRINLLKRSSFHPNYSFTLAKTASKLLQTTVFIHALGNFIEGWILKGTWYQPLNIVTLLITIIFMIFIWGVVANKIHPCFYTTHVYENITYTDADNQGKFFHSYKAQNPASRNQDFQNLQEKYYGIDIQQSKIMHHQSLLNSTRRVMI